MIPPEKIKYLSMKYEMFHTDKSGGNRSELSM